MPPEDDQVTPPPSDNHPWEQAFKEGELPRRNEISIGTIARKINELIQAKRPWDSSDVIAAIREDVGFEEPVLRAPIQVAEGTQLILVLNSQQYFPVHQFFGTYHLSKDPPLYALIEGVSEEPRRVEVLVKQAMIKPKTIDHLVISTEAARQLGIDPQSEKKDIRVLEFYQKIEDIDLDKLR